MGRWDAPTFRSGCDDANGRVDRRGAKLRLLPRRPLTQPFEGVQSATGPSGVATPAQALDPLTGLPPRADFLAIVDSQLGFARRFDRSLTMACIRVNLFGVLRDSPGQLFGIHLFRQVAERLAGSIRSADLIGRLDDDLFGLLLPGTDFENGLAAALRLKTELERPYVVDGTAVSISVAVGVATFPEGDAADAEALVAQADVAPVATAPATRRPVAAVPAETPGPPRTEPTPLFAAKRDIREVASRTS